MPNPFFFPEPEQYIFDFDAELDPETNVYHCPIEVDTEYYHPPYDLNKTHYFKQQTLTLQFRHLREDVGKIYWHADANRKGFYPSSDPRFPALTYLNDLGWNVSLDDHYVRSKATKVVHFHFYTFFGIAELFRMFGGTVLDEIDSLTRRQKGQRITFQRRLIADCKEGVYQSYVELRNVGLLVGNKSCTIRISFVDTCAVQGMSSYKELCGNTGVELAYKDNFTSEEKSDMLRMLEERPTDFTNYALGDLYNYPALVGHYKNINKVYEDLDITKYAEIPRLTIGATVSRIVRSCLQKECNDADIKTIQLLTENATAKKMSKEKSHTSIYLTKVDGGRCRNNRPKDCRIKGAVADIDISSCYGEGLRVQEYPLGRPFIFDYRLDSEINDYLTLREFIKKYGDELVPGLWFARVSCRKDKLLTHRQDFLSSWIPPKDIYSIGEKSEFVECEGDSLEVDDGETKIFLNEVRLAVFQHDALQWLMNVCGKQQREELLDNLIVETAMIYPATQRVKSFEELMGKLATHEGRNTTSRRGKKKITEIAECYYWYGVNMGGLIVDKLLIERKKYPKKTPLNELFKLIINTIYGDMVSPFFSVGNVCVGNNITARARAMAWYMEKGLNGFQTITDGCAFDLNRVVVSKDRYLTSQSLTPMNHEGRDYKYAPLGGEIWEYIDGDVKCAKVKRGEVCISDENLLSTVDKLAGDHLRSLFPVVDVLHQSSTDVFGEERLGQFGFETKAVYGGAVFHGTANYAFFDEYGRTLVYKMRSHRKRGCKTFDFVDDRFSVISEDSYPAKDFLEALYNDPHCVKRGKTYIHTAILKLGVRTRNYDVTFKDATVFPGCSFDQVRLFKEFTLTQFTFQTYDQYCAWRNEGVSLRSALEQTIECDYVDSQDYSLDYQRMIRDVYDLIAQGGMGVLSHGKKSRDKLKGSGKSIHPAAETLSRGKQRVREIYGFEASEAFELTALGFE